MTFAKPCSTPIDTSNNGDVSTPFEDPILYRSVVGALLYATIIRPDVAFAVNKAFQHMQATTKIHWTAVKRILRYLQGTLGYSLQFKHTSPLQIQAFSDADRAGDLTGGMSVFLGPNLISWCSRKQKTVSRCT
ncbi:uncharacterized protein LOC113279352 [Papaver somniferum]|uniref:uncharacterized protein LOC113279352 n=1 Tax=Papaver somniferum TaxID=3469 RepID=UPI000E6FF1BB|nr:uncharacterized protein LOC113279352 [Papaver somniferum]